MKKKKLFRKLLAAVLAATVCVGTLDAVKVAAPQASAVDYPTVNGFVFDSTVSDFELMELQNAYLRGMIPKELIGDVNRDITQAEFRRLFARLMEYMKITPAQDMENWLSEGTDTAITRGKVADEFMQAYYVFMDKPFELLSMSGVPSTNIYCSGPSEVLERNGEDGWLMFYTHNTDSTTGVPLMDRNLDGYLRLEDNMTVKEAVQLMYRFSNRCMPELEYVSLSEIKTPITLTEEELSAAAKIPTPTYSELPKYQGTLYMPGGCAYEREDAVYETDFSTLSDMGFNFIRYFFAQDFDNLMDENRNICLSNVEALDKAVHLAIKYGIHLRLEISGDILINMKNGVKSESGEVIFTAEEYQQYLASVFGALAARYKNVPNSILSFHIFTEPWAHDEFEKNSPDQYVTLQQLCDFTYLIADAVWAEDDDRLMATDGPWGSYPSIAIAEEGIKRNLTSNGKERRILQNFHCFIPDYCWTNGFYGEMPSVSNYNADYIPPSVDGKNRYVIKANSDGYGAGTEIKICDDNGNTAYLSLVTTKNGNVVEELQGVEVTNSKYKTYTLTKDADAFTVTCTDPDHSSSLKYIWITYPEKASEKIPIFGFFSEDGSTTYGSGGYEEFAKNNANGLMDVQDIAHSTVVRFTDRKTTHITIGGASHGHLGNTHGYIESETDNAELKLTMQIADVDIQIKDGNDNQDYSATFTDCYYTDDKTVYHFTPEDIMDAFIKVWTDFQEKYGTVCMQNETGPNNGSRKEVIYDYLDLWLRHFTEAGMPWGGIAANNGWNGCLLDDYIYQGDYVQYDFHRVEAGQLTVMQKYMTRFDIDEVGQLPYTGKAQEPVLNVKFKGKSLTLGKDYEVSYHDNTEPGMATAVVTGIGEYEGIFTTQRFFISIFEGSNVPIIIDAAAGDGQVTLTWEAVAGAEMYRVYKYENDAYTRVYSGDSLATTAVITGLTNGNEYGFVVSAKVNGSWTDYSDPEDLVYATPVKPEKPTILGIKPGENKVKLEWKAVTGAEMYRVYTYENGTYTRRFTCDGSRTIATVSDLKANVKYGFVVSAKANGVWTDYSDKADLVYATPTAPVEPVVVKPEITAYKPGNYKVKLEWKAVEGAEMYRVYTYENGAYTRKFTCLGSRNVATVTSLVSGVKLGFVVSAKVGGTWTDYTDKADLVYATPVGDPAPVITGVKGGDGKVKISWYALSGAEMYRVYTYENGTYTRKFTCDGSTNVATVTGLTNGKEYAFVVSAKVGGVWTNYKVSELLVYATPNA